MFPFLLDLHVNFKLIEIRFESEYPGCAERVRARAAAQSWKGGWEGNQGGWKGTWAELSSLIFQVLNPPHRN